MTSSQHYCISIPKPDIFQYCIGMQLGGNFATSLQQEHANSLGYVFSMNIDAGYLWTCSGKGFFHRMLFHSWLYRLVFRRIRKRVNY